MAGSSRTFSGRTTSSGGPDLTQDEVEKFLKVNPSFLASFVQKYVSTDTVQSWLTDRTHLNFNRRRSLSQWKFTFGGAGGATTSTNGRGGGGAVGGAPNPGMLKNLALTLQKNPHIPNLLWELGICISSAVSANFFVLYLIDPQTKGLRRFSQLKKGSQDLTDYQLEDEKQMTLAVSVCKLREPCIMSRLEALARFPCGLGRRDENIDKSKYVLCHPIVRADGEVSGVLELYRQDITEPFCVEDQEIVNSYLVWGGVALHYADLNAVMNRHKKQNDFLLDVVRSIFQDMISMDVLINKVMEFAKQLVEADRASLFLVDTKTRELHARLFDTGTDAEGGHCSLDSPDHEIRIPLGVGVAGQVAATGEILNIRDAYNDIRFNREVDKVTGYVTKTILCMPIFNRGSVIGVVQMLNKRNGVFSEEDEKAFATYATYCGLALHHANLYDQIRRSEQKYNVALEVLSYYNTCSEEEFREARATGILPPQEAIGIDNFHFNPMATDDMKKVHHSVYMFVDLFGLNHFDLDSIYRFFLTVKKNYRKVPYHNWTHGFTVANCMYAILKRTRTDSFRPLERLALYIGCLCHDVDHRGKNNKFMLESASPIAAMYSTSTMEHHHFNQTVTILQRDGHNIFGKLSSEDYKAILGNIKHCILATDLATFFGNKKRLDDVVASGDFSWNSTEPRELVQAIAMTAADLCASAKPWEIQLETVNVIFLEFYEQGDLEKQAGRKPIPMMDRDCADEQPGSQVGFLQGICIPCYGLLSKLIPETHPLLEGCKLNLAQWQKLVEQQHKHET